MTKKIPPEIITAVTGMLTPYGISENDVRELCSGTDRQTELKQKKLQLYRRIELA